jgi:hypothetical protein
MGKHIEEVKQDILNDFSHNQQLCLRVNMEVVTIGEVMIVFFSKSNRFSKACPNLSKGDCGR